MSKRTPIKLLQNILIQKGYKPIFVDYKNSKQKLEVICPKHGNFTTNAILIKRGAGCSKCGRETYAEKRRGSIEKIAKKAEELGVKLLNSKFPNTHGPQILNFECPTHGKFTQDHRQLRYGRGCSKCGHIRGGMKNTRTTEQFQEAMKKSGYKVLTPYINSKTRIEMECKIHGKFEMIPSDLLDGHGCQRCGLTYSKTQKELFDFINSFYPDAIENTRKIIKPLELDIFIPSIGLAIEYCGLYWHNESKKDKKYHVNKMKACNEKGIRLITIFEDEWIIRNAQVKNFLISVLNKNQEKIGARETIAKEVSKKEASIFLEENHIQGSANFKIAFGLYSNDTLIGIITGNKHHRNLSSKILVLNRLAFSHGVMVYGGASRLVKKLVEYAKNEGYKKLISWSDNRWSEGKVYKMTGFELSEEIPYDYSYVKGKYKRFSKQSCTKKALSQIGGVGKTELEMANSLGLKRIWDCGKKRWEIDLE